MSCKQCEIVWWLVLVMLAVVGGARHDHAWTRRRIHRPMADTTRAAYALSITLK